MKINIFSLQGQRDYNEDRYCTSINDKESIFCLFDGHGGSFVSSYLSKNFLKYLENNFSSSQINTCLQTIQKKLQTKYEEKAGECGSTVLVIRLNTKENLLQVINLGDCRAVIKYGDKVKQLNTEHKPTNHDEKIRITLSKGELEYDSEDEIYRVDGYSLSRSMGDTNYDILSQTAEVKTLKYPNNTEFIVMGTDGLWDVLSNDYVKKFVEKFNSKDIPNFIEKKSEKNIAYLLCKKALDKGSVDNITVIVIYLS